MVEIELWVLVDEDGDYGLGREEDEACDSYTNDIGGEGIAKRKVRLLVKVPFAVPTLTGTAPPEGEAALTVS